MVWSGGFKLKDKIELPLQNKGNVLYKVHDDTLEDSFLIFEDDVLINSRRIM